MFQQEITMQYCVMNLKHDVEYKYIYTLWLGHT